MNNSDDFIHNEPNDLRVICPTCGNMDTTNYCSICGSKLRFAEEEQKNYHTFLISLQEIFFEVIKPFFSYMKTAWGLFVKPEEFFTALFKKQKPIHAISFPLSSFWKKVSSEYHHIDTPLKFYLISFGTIIIFRALLGFDISFISTSFLDQGLPGIIGDPLTIYIGIILLIVPLTSASIFEILTFNEIIPTSYKIGFWFYASCFLFFWILLIPLTQFPFKLFIWFLKLAISLKIALPGDDLLLDQSNLGAEVYALIGGIFFFYFYFYWVMPYKVFRYLYNWSQAKVIVYLFIITLVFYKLFPYVYWLAIFTRYYLLLLIPLAIWLLSLHPKNRRVNSSYSNEGDKKLSDVVKMGRKQNELLGLTVDKATLLLPPSEPKKPQGLGFWKYPIIIYGAFLFIVFSHSSFFILNLLVPRIPSHFLLNAREQTLLVILNLIVRLVLIMGTLFGMFISYRLLIKTDKKIKREKEKRYISEKEEWNRLIECWKKFSYSYRDQLVINDETHEKFTPEVFTYHLYQKAKMEPEELAT
jgi:hypothetical protein